MRNDFRGKKNNFEETYYDLEFDKELIIQSISKQYHILPSEQEELHYSDWYRLVAGLMHDTPLGQIVRIRCEDDKEVIKNFSRYEQQVRTDWANFRSKKLSEEFTEKDKIDTARYFEKMFEQMFS